VNDVEQNSRMNPPIPAGGLLPENTPLTVFADLVFDTLAPSASSYPSTSPSIGIPTSSEFPSNSPSIGIPTSTDFPSNSPFGSSTNSPTVSDFPSLAPTPENSAGVNVRRLQQQQKIDPLQVYGAGKSQRTLSTRQEVCLEAKSEGDIVQCCVDVTTTE
jgi:hypothetical protein